MTRRANNLLKLHSFSHQNTDLELRDRLVFSADEIEAFLSEVDRELGVECAVLSTCNRTEFYWFGPESKLNWSDVKPIVANQKSIPEKKLDAPTEKQGLEAARHLFRVTASLESVALGENEILGQVKEAHRMMLEHTMSSTHLDELFQFAVRTGKTVRTETELCAGAVSVSSVAVDLAHKIFGDLSSSQVLVIGAGEMAKKAGQHFVGRSVGEVVVVNRSPETGRKLADILGGTFEPLRDLETPLLESDVAVVATGADEFLVDEEIIERVAQNRSRPLFLIDISNPRNVAPVCADYPGIYVYNMNDLEQVVESNLEARKSEIPRAEECIEAHLEQWKEQKQSRAVRPTIATLAQYFDKVREDELERVRGDLDKEELDRLDRFSKSLTNKLLHYPIMFLRSAVEDNQLDEEDLQLVWSLYNLDSFKGQSDEN